MLWCLWYEQSCFSLPTWKFNLLGVFFNRKCGVADSKVQRSQGKASRLTPQKSDPAGDSPCPRDLRHKETPEKTELEKSSGQIEAHSEVEDNCEHEDLPCMLTTEMYLSCWHQPPVSPLREMSPKKEEDVDSKCFKY